jgi:prolyl oligopeptidase
MKTSWRLPTLLVTLAAQTGFTARAAEAPAPPTTPQHDVVETYHGTLVHDPYRWLEAADAAPVQQWIDAQNAHTEAVVSGFLDHGRIAKRAGQLALTSTERSKPQIAAGTLFYFRETPPQPQRVLVAEPWPHGDARVLFDTNAAGGDVAITNYWPSPDGRMVAVGTARGGDENTTIRFIEVATGKQLADALPYAGGGQSPQALVWDADGKGVIYVRLPLPGTVPPARAPFDAQLYHHILNSPANADTASLGKPPAPIAEHILISSEAGNQAAAFIYYGDGSYEDVYLRSGGTWRKVLGSDSRVQIASSKTDGAAWLDGRLLMVSYQNAPRGQIVALDDDGHVQVLVPQQPWALDGVAPIKGGFLVDEINGPDSRVQQFDAEGHPIRTLPLPTGIGVTGMAGSKDSTLALIQYSGWSLPSRWTQYDVDSGKLTTIFEVKPAADYSQVRTWRLNAKSTGGVSVPITVIALNGTPKDGQRPLILTAYGGYGSSTQSAFIGSTLAWLERGGVYAVANIRGGGEFGDGWHQDGRRANKQHCFDDFSAAAHALVADGWTNAAHLGIRGRSNGGLLMGAALTQHPGDYRAVVSGVGIYDMLRVELSPNGEYNTREYGTVSRLEEFAWLYGYSPLQQVRAGTAYPAVLLQTGENDPRVSPWQSRKFAAALQKSTSSGRPILLLTRRNEGHGVTSSFSQRTGNAGIELSFFAEELGLSPAP